MVWPHRVGAIYSGGILWYIHYQFFASLVEILETNVSIAMQLPSSVYKIVKQCRYAYILYTSKGDQTER